MKSLIWTYRHVTYSNSKNQNFNSKGSGSKNTQEPEMIRVSLHCTYVRMGCLHNWIWARKDFPSLKLSGQYMADNVNDKGDSRTIQEIVRGVVANLRVVFCKIRTSARHVT